MANTFLDLHGWGAKFDDALVKIVGSEHAALAVTNASGSPLASEGTLGSVKTAVELLATTVSGGKILVDTELTLNGDVMVDNVKGCSTDGVKPNAYIKVDADWHPQIDVLSIPAVIVTLPATASNVIVDIPANGATDRVQLPTNVCKRASIQSKASNTGKVFIGGSTVTNASGANEGVDIDPGDTFGPIDISNINGLYVATETAGNDVKVIFLT